MLKHLNITIRGRVHGVGFRYSAHDAAFELNLLGFVCNQSDGSVYAEVEGEEAQLQQFVEWCKKGPATAKVTDVIANEDTFKKFVRFEIRKTGLRRAPS